MSETIQPIQANSVAGYDEAEGVTYDEQSVSSSGFMQMGNLPEVPSTTYTDGSEDWQEETIQEPEVSIQDGEVKFRDDFFGDINDEPDEIERQEEPERVEEQETSQTQEPSQALYTDEEYRNTPFTQWEIDRLPEAVKPYANAVREQLIASQRQQQIQYQIAKNPEKPPYIQEVREYSIDELSSEAEKLACQKLGLTNPEDFEPAYESRHAAAREMARRELLQKRNEQVANYKQQSNDYQFLRQVNAEISIQPDFAEYQKWFTAEAAKDGKIPAQINDALIQHAKTHGGDFRKIASVVAGWYQAFRYSKAQQAQQAQQNKLMNFEPRQNKRVGIPPVLEGTQGGHKKATANGFNMRNFGELDTDAQAQALMDMGIV